MATVQDKLKRYKALRQLYITRITQLDEIAQGARTDPNMHSNLKVRCRGLQGILEDFEKQHLGIVNIIAVMEEPDLQAEEMISQDFMTKYHNVEAIYYDLFENKNDKIQIPNDTLNQVNHISLPQISLVKFTGDVKHFPTYIDMYNALVHNNNSLSDIAKFNYLISTLEGPPLALVKCTPMIGTNYMNAYKSLTDRYSNKRRLATAYWKEIANSPPLLNENAKALRNLLDTFHENLAALDALEFEPDNWDFILMNMLLDRLDQNSLTAFEMHHSSTSIPTYADVRDFLLKHCVALETIASSGHRKSKKPENFKSQVFNAPRNSNFTTNQSSRNRSAFFTNTSQCLLCNDAHIIYQCPIFLEKNPQQRFEIVKRHKCCVNCLATSHISIKCSSLKRCRKCQKNHHTLLHFDSSENTQQNCDTALVTNSNHVPRPGPSRLDSQNDNTESPIKTLTGMFPDLHNVLLSTVLLNIQDVFGHFHTFRAILDSGSQASFITKTCANRLGLTKFNIALSIQGLEKMCTPARSGVHCTICPVDKDFLSINVDFVILDKICDNVPTATIAIDKWAHISNLKLADPYFNKPGKIDVLLGADVFPTILENGRLSGNPNEPVAINTIFGWTLLGKIPSTCMTKVNSFFAAYNNNENLDYTLNRFWQIEEVPDINVTSPEDTFCQKFFSETTTRNSEGRYIVSLPFKNELQTFGDTRSIALRRFYSLERRLLNNPTLYTAYSEFLYDYLNNGHMEQVPYTVTPPNVYYIPHHCIIKRESSTTPLRVVFDASSHAPGMPSLNDVLHTGPKLQRDLVTILLNFRIYRFVFTADIKQMYRQILLTPAHRKFQRILWRFSPSQSILDYQLNTVTYGVVSAPYLAIRTLLQLAQDENNFPLASKILDTDIYVDDVVSGSQSIENAKLMQGQLIDLLHKAGFELRKWASNEPQLLCELPDSYLHKQSLSCDFEDTNTLKILGLHWNPTSDTFFYSFDSSEINCTKRTILSQLARIFDPLGFLNPLTIMAKLLIQHLWSLGLEWDQTPPLDVVKKWQRFKNELNLLSTFHIVRHLNITNFSSCELHGFCDGSEVGYCATLYLRVLYNSSEIQTFLVCAKSKVAPLKRISIPRVELCAAVLLAKLMTFVLNTFSKNITFNHIYAWSDSSVALSWIKSSPHRWKTFISNRVTYIQERLAPSYWHYIPSKLNPADCGSRGFFASELINCSLWWVGPEFLCKPQNSWNLPKFDTLNNSVIAEEERKITLSSFLSLDVIDTLLEQFSCLSKIKRIVAYVLRFIHNLRNPNNKIVTKFLTITDLYEALLIIIKRVQYVHFKTDMLHIKNETPPSKTLRKLNPFLDSNDILRVGGRLCHTKLSYAKKFPILLPSNSPFTKLLISEIHNTFLHTGVQATYFLLNQKFWILSAKKVIKKIIFHCHTCWKTNPKPYQPKMGNLPEFRVTQLKPFCKVAVDYGGPFTIKLGKLRSSKTTKSYVCLFVCCATKALHLELASDLSTESFLAAFRRFMARRGRCTDVYSDCGTNFVGADNYLKQIFTDIASTEAIHWHFNPPSAPHFGGLWEAGIKSVKSHLARVVGDQILTYEELSTVLIQIEAVLNSRPLSPISTDPNDLLPLTPGHFLTLEPLTAIPDPDTTHININRLTRWQLLQNLHRDFWNRWHQEYLHTLQQRCKWHTTKSSITIGTMVLLKNELSPPLKWPLGRIIELHPGADGIVRVATVRTAKGIFKRPLVKLCPLPTES